MILHEKLQTLLDNLPPRFFFPSLFDCFQKNTKHPFLFESLWPFGEPRLLGFGGTPATVGCQVVEIETAATEWTDLGVCRVAWFSTARSAWISL